MLTLGQYIKNHAKLYNTASRERSNGDHAHWWFAGHAVMCRKLLSELDSSTLSMPVKLKEEVT